jgi:putative hemolysin
MAELVDIEKVIMSKNGGKQPSPLLVRILKKIIHEKEINQILTNSKADNGVDFVDDVLNALDVKIEVTGFENIDPDKKYIFASNHPLGGLDGMSLIKVIGRQYDGKIKFMANDLLMNLKPLRNTFVPINKHGAQGRTFAAAVTEAFDSDNQILIFPAGACSRFRVSKGIYDLEWSKTFVNKAVQHQRDVVPIRFKGRNSIFFYALAFFRKSIGIKVNIEMLFLPHEMFGNKHKTFKAYIGRPIPWETFDKTSSPQKWAQKVKETVYKLSK